MISTEMFTYVDHEERAYDAQVIALDTDANAELMVYGGEDGAWTVVNVPHVDNPARPIPGAYWKGDLDILFPPAPGPEATATTEGDEETPAPELADKPKSKPRSKKG